jgi:hypothetical protein
MYPCVRAHEVLRRWPGSRWELIVQHETDVAVHTELLFVGDHEDDCKSGRRAGMCSALLTNGDDETYGSYTQRVLNDNGKVSFIDLTVCNLSELALRLALVEDSSASDETILASESVR